MKEEKKIPRLTTLNTLSELDFLSSFFSRLVFQASSLPPTQLPSRSEDEDAYTMSSCSYILYLSNFQILSSPLSGCYVYVCGFLGIENCSEIRFSWLLNSLNWDTWSSELRNYKIGREFDNVLLTQACLNLESALINYFYYPCHLSLPPRCTLFHHP